MDAEKLAKVLALAGSDNDSEALHALRTAKRLLASEGADFVDVARRFAQAGNALPAPGSSQVQIEDLEDAIFDLRNQIRHLKAENDRLRQTRPAAPSAGEPSNLADAARDAADAIRLRAELADLRDRLEINETEILHLRAQAAGMSEQLRGAALKAEDQESRRARLEAENRRLSTANLALAVEIEKLQAATRCAAAESLPRAERGRKRGGKAKSGPSQYALF